MEDIIPIFKSHYSLGRSILTLKMPKEFQENESSDSVFDICEEAAIKEMYLVDDNMAGFLEAYTNAESLKIKLIFGLRLTFCPDSSNKSEEGRRNSYKNIIFAKNAKGYKQLIKIYTFAAQEGFYYEPRMDFENLKPLWSNDLLLAIPFYDSFLYNNKYTDSQCVPDFSFTEPVFFVEDNDVLFDKDMQERVLDFCSDKYETVKTKSIYYKEGKDFGAYLTFRCINNRTVVEKPNFDGMCSDEFSAESWAARTGTEMVDKPRKPVKEKEKIEAPVIITKKLSEKPQRDQDTPRGQASLILQRATNRLICKRNNWRIEETTERYAEYDGRIFDKDGNRLGSCENKMRPFAGDLPFHEHHLYEYISGDIGWLITANKIDFLSLLSKEGHGFGNGHLMIPHDRKIFMVDICNEKGEFVCEYYRKKKLTWADSNHTRKRTVMNAFINMKKSPCVSFNYSDSDLLTDPIPLSEECVRFSGLTHMSEKEAHDNILANEKWPWNWVKWIK